MFASRKTEHSCVYQLLVSRLSLASSSLASFPRLAIINREMNLAHRSGHLDKSEKMMICLLSSFFPDSKANGPSSVSLACFLGGVIGWARCVCRKGAMGREKCEKASERAREKKPAPLMALTFD